MRLRIKDIASDEHEAVVPQTNAPDAQSRALIDGVYTVDGVWIAPQGIVTITVVDDGGE